MPFNWTSVSGATGYQLNYFINNGTIQTINVSSSTLTDTIKQLNHGDTVKMIVTPTGPSGCFKPDSSTCYASACPSFGVTVPSDISTCNGSLITTIHFSSTQTGATFTWNNNNTMIGLTSPSGSDSITQFHAVDTTDEPISATITVTPAWSTCPGTIDSFHITVKPVVKPLFDQIDPKCINSYPPDVRTQVYK